jgi:seryl-tRNA synthetase
MLNLKFIQENPELVIAKLKKKNFDATNIVNQITELYRQKNQLQNKADQAKAEMNKISGEVGLLMHQGKREEAEVAKTRTAEIKESIKQFDIDFAAIEEQVYQLQVQLPNLPADLVPEGRGAADNLVKLKVAAIFQSLPENALPHWELAAKYNLIDFELGVKLTGAGFPVYRGKGSSVCSARSSVSF